MLVTKNCFRVTVSYSSYLKLKVPSFEETFNKTIRSICTGEKEEIAEAKHGVDPNACKTNFCEKGTYLFSVNYIGKMSDKFAYSLKKLNAPCKVSMTMVKTKSVVSYASEQCCL